MQTITQHTPGPWTFAYGSEFRIMHGSYMVMMVGDDRRAIPSTADARLMAAAPDLLAALIRARDELNEAGLFNAGRSCDVAIAKAIT